MFSLSLNTYFLGKNLRVRYLWWDTDDGDPCRQADEEETFRLRPSDALYTDLSILPNMYKPFMLTNCSVPQIQPSISTFTFLSMFMKCRYNDFPCSMYQRHYYLLNIC